MKKLAYVIVILAMTFYSLAIVNKYQFNWYSDSLPYGIYKQVDKPPVKGTLAATCLNYEIAEHGLERKYLVKGSCDTGIQPVVKPITAIEGDLVTIDEETVSINGHVMNGYKVHHTDSIGRPMKRFSQDQYVLKNGEYWLMSNYKDNSYDSRYWGAVTISYVVEPVITVKSYKTIQ